ncbi:amidohydrolase [Parapedobacter sp. 10938]|uniref:amidohydrolase n=1 Tax=Parapedobacter flavus TaxID=3110225 RepID=UPI002DBCC907|nr:amidohydrolase [Parapedobacter sp. 10938]MEC3881728.1 amidohydrolase [Parapedobacter sp. 10938]
MNNTIFTLAAVATAMLCSCNSSQQADLIVYNAVVYTVDSSFNTAEAFAVRDGEFIAVGTSDEIRSAYGAEETIDAQGQAIYPGFYDAHAHFFGYAQTYGQADLSGATSFDEIIDRLKAFRSEHPYAPWLLGRGWDQNLWEDKSFPTKDRLEAAFPNIPVYLVRIDGHAALASGKALELAGITGPVDIEGGLVETRRDEPTGILVDNAMDAVSALIPRPTTSQLTQFLKKAEKACLAVGLTTVSDAGLGRASLQLLDSLYTAGQLRIRNHAMIGLSDENLDHYLAAGPYVGDRFTVRAFKILADGALGSRGACLLHPYADAPTSGFLLFSPQAIDSAIARIVNSDFQVATHAIGDSTNRLILEIYGKYLKGENDRRWRIEHAQVISPADFNKFGAYDIIPSVQPTHATSDMYWAEDRLGPERIKGAYAFRQLLEEAGLLALGSDFPVEHINPLYGFHAAVARVDKNDYPEGGFQPENAIDREAALRGMTIWAAYSVFEEDTRGSIEVGKKADFVRLGKDIMTIPANEIPEVKVLQTAIAGETVYRKE